MKVAAKAAGALAELDCDLCETGFGRDCRGLARELYASFTATVVATRGTEDESIAWAIGRALATDLHAFGARRGALALLDGLTEFGAIHGDSRTTERLKEIRETVSEKLAQRRTAIARAKTLLSRMPTAFRRYSTRSRRPDPVSLLPKSLTVSSDFAKERPTTIEPTLDQREASAQLSPISSGQAGEPAMPALAEASWPLQTSADGATAALGGVGTVEMDPHAPILEPRLRAIHFPTSSPQKNGPQAIEPTKLELNARTTDLEPVALAAIPESPAPSLAASITRVDESPEVTSSDIVESAVLTPLPVPPDPVQMAPMTPADGGLEAAATAKAMDIEFVTVAPNIEPPATDLASGGPQNGTDVLDAQRPNLPQDKPGVSVSEGVTVRREEHPVPQLASPAARRIALRHGGEFALATTAVLIGIVIFYLAAGQTIHPLRHSLSLPIGTAISLGVRAEANAPTAIVPPNKSSIRATANEQAGTRQDQFGVGAAKILASWAPVKFGPLVNLQTRQGAGSIQARLKALGYFHYAVDGVWGPTSVAALSSFRQQHGLGPDGVWDLPTQWALLEN